MVIHGDLSWWAQQLVVLGWVPALLAALGAVGGLMGRGAAGQAAERGNRNDYQANQNNQINTQYGISQNALLQALLGASREGMDAYQTRQGAITSALGNESQEATGRYGIQQGATSNALANQSQENLQRARLGLEAPTVRARQSVMGSLMANMQPVSVANTNPRLAGRVPTIQGGLNPAVLGADTRQHGQELSRSALMAQLSGSDVPAATDFRRGVLDVPKATDFRGGVLDAPPPTNFGGGVLPPPALQGYQGAGRGESLMSLIASLLGGASGIGNIVQDARGQRTTGGWTFDPGPPPPGYRRPG